MKLSPKKYVVYSYAKSCTHTHTYIYIYIYIYICRMQDTYWHKDKQTSLDSLTKYTSHFIVTFVCERELETEHNCNILTPTLMAVSIVSFSFSRAAQPGARVLTQLAFSTTSYQQLLWSLTHQGPKGPFGLMCLSLRHLVSITPTVWLIVLTGLYNSYIIVQRPLNRLLDLWNGMFDRHQAEIIVMQFTGHSLPVHQFISVPWEF